ncbi:MAG TPA: branched-chain amino acid transporter AzlD [Firmicutes bacterium]|nr:branched-chain amino acid transporter AzlD [Bacillota bacterium]
MTVMLTRFELIITIAVIALATMLTRFLPFLVFGGKKETPPFIQKLQGFLPQAASGLLVVYCFRHVDFLAGRRGLPEIIAALAVILLHRGFKNPLISIGGGTAVYMVLVQKYF